VHVQEFVIHVIETTTAGEATAPDGHNPKCDQ
jgi:hypothetical protein